MSTETSPAGDSYFSGLAMRILISFSDRKLVYWTTQLEDYKRASIDYIF
jgi:hypothetical protein